MTGLSKQQAAEAIRTAASERDAIQANLLDLDGSFGKRLLTGSPSAGTQLTGISRERWDRAAAALSELWELFSTYSGVIDRAGGLAAGRLGPRELTELSELLTGPSVEVARGPAPLARRDLADTGLDRLTLATARARMRAEYQQVTEVVTTAEQVWTLVAGRLDAVADALADVDSLGDQVLGSEQAAIRAELDRQRAALNTDPLGAQAAAADRLADRARAVGARAAELARVRDGARQRISALRAIADSARAAYGQAQDAYQRVAVKIAAVPPPPGFTDPAPRLAALEPLLASGNWPALSAALAELERDTPAVLTKCAESERTVVSLLSQRDELRGLLDAYRAKAGRLGAAEDPGLAGLYDQARALLWTAPCDLSVASAAVTSYQQAVLALGGHR
jgi:hypothetical protein